MSALRMCEDAVVRAVPDSRERARLAREVVTRLGRAAPELAPYQDEPPQMPSGVVGKFGFLRLVFRADGARSVLSDMDRRAPFLVQKALYWDEALPDMPCVMIITTTGCVAQGDRLAVQIHVGAGARAPVTTQSAPKIHMMSSNYAAQLQEITVEEGGYLEYAPDPVIPHRSSRFLTDTRLVVAESGALVYSEILCPAASITTRMSCSALISTPRASRRIPSTRMTRTPSQTRDRAPERTVGARGEAAAAGRSLWKNSFWSRNAMT